MEGASKTNDFKTHGPYCVEHVISAGGPGAAAAASKGGWRITLAGRGAAKGSTRIATKVEKVTPLGKVEVWGFRQDSLATMLPNTEVPQCIVSIADGHGPSVPGQLMSQSSHLKMLPRVASVAGEILQWLRDGNTAAVEQKVKDIFAEIDEDLLCTDPITSPHASGGATYTLNHKIMDPETGRMHTIISNVGDSPAVKVDLATYGITEVSEDQNCDNKQAVERYCNLCRDLNQTPRKVILGRFNFQSPLGKRCSWMGGWGDWVEPYSYSQKANGDYIISDNTEVMRRFYENAPVEFQPALRSGGPQSLRARPENLRALAEGGYPSANYGSTLEGVLQMPFSLGDKADKRGPLHVKCEPNVAIISDEAATTLEVMGTDGVMDCLPDKELHELLVREGAATKAPEVLCNRIAELTEALAKSNWFPFSSLGVPAWDDCGFWVVRCEPILPTPEGASAAAGAGTGTEPEAAKSALLAAGVQGTGVTKSEFGAQMSHETSPMTSRLQRQGTGKYDSSASKAVAGRAHSKNNFVDNEADEGSGDDEHGQMPSRATSHTDDSSELMLEDFEDTDKTNQLDATEEFYDAPESIGSAKAPAPAATNRKLTTL